VNADTAALVRRPYLEIVDDLLTAIVGGVVNEAIAFDVKLEIYRLSREASALRSVTGTADKQPYTFQQTIDYDLVPPDAVAWLPDGRRPDDNTTFFVDYLVPGSTSPLSDVNVGSVTRTLAEAIGREIATVYEQVNEAYRSGFVGTAKGTSLDLVVAILGVERKTKDFAQGLVTFFRDETSTGAITIAAGTLLVAGTPERPQFETTETRTLLAGTARIDVPVRATQEFKGEVGKVPAGSIADLVVLLEGIARVSNLDATFLGGDDETDEELRIRAKAALRAFSKGTQAALEQAVREQRGPTVLEVWDPNAPPPRTTDPGRVSVLVEAEPEAFAGVLQAVHEVRAAGVELALVARYVYLKLRVRGTIAAGVPPAGQAKIRTEVVAALRAYLDGLESREPAKGEKLLEALGEVDGFEDPELVDVIPRRSDVTRPGLETLVDELAAVLTPPPADETALRAALTGVLTSASVEAPSAARIFDRGLVVGPGGQRATDAEIKAGTFEVVVPDDGQAWWIVAELSVDDVELKAEEA
jgi:uncharacterized phage protein gp47/JayE